MNLNCTITPPIIRYQITIRPGLLSDKVGMTDQLTSLGSRFVLIADQTVSDKYAKALQEQLAPLDLLLLTIPAGEQSKTRQTKEWLEDQLLERRYGRDTCIIAMGGGMTTDLVGFLAATYCRGVPLVSIPTSLLAMVDASIGGKTAVNVRQGKNQIGSISQPSAVWLDPLVLKSLPAKELRNGFAEMLKHGLVADRDYFVFLEQQARSLLALQEDVMEQAIYHSCRIKNAIVQQDECENGKRRLLNFGHTIGHAIELAAQYAIGHGEAVALGMLVESAMAVKLGYLSMENHTRIRSALKQYGLPETLPRGIEMESILAAMQWDKKNRKGRSRFVLLTAIGQALPCDGSYCMYVDHAIVQEALQEIASLEPALQ
jgi:3-dehydroquinate synthase